MSLNRVFPFLNWLPNYKKKWLKGDIIAGITVGVMLIPQGLAYAMIAGLPPIYGLYAALIPPLIYFIFGTSRNISVGPVAMDSIIVISGVSAIAAVGTEHFISLVILLGFLVGLIQLVFGIFRIGFLVNFISKPVVSGFTSGAAIIIALSQIKYILGVDIGQTDGIVELIIELSKVVKTTNIPNLIVGIVAIVLLVILKNKFKKIPAALVIVIIGILIVKYLGLYNYGVLIIGEIPKGLPKFTVPNFEYNTILELLPIALTLAIIGFMEAFSIGKSLEKRQDNKISANKEFTALGLSNIIGSFFLSFVVTSSFSRSAVNNNSGANTQLSTVFASIIVGFTLIILTPVFYFLPKAAIAAIIIVAILGLFNYTKPIQLWKYDKRDAIILIITFLTTVFLGIEEGIFIGVVLSISIMIYNSTKPHMVVLGGIPNTILYRNVQRFKDVIIEEDILIIRFDSQLNFTNESFFKDSIFEKVEQKGEKLKLVIINANSLSSIDSSGVHVLQDVLLYLNDRNVELYFTGLIGPVRDTLYKSELISEIGLEKCFLSVQLAVDFYHEKLDDDNKGNNHKYVKQVNL